MPYLADAESAARLVNAGLRGVDGLRALVGERVQPRRHVEQRDVEELRELVAELRPVFEAAGAGESETVVRRLNELLSERRVTPQLRSAGGPADGQPGWRVHGTTPAGTVADLLAAEALMGLASLTCELGPDRLGVCGAPGCAWVFVDTSPNRSRRYCSDRCSSRTNVAAYRARQRREHTARTPG